MTASASCTGTPSAAKSLAVSLLPMPMEPVSPMTKGLAMSQRLDQPGAQSRRDIGLHTKKGFEGWHGLMHQHAQPVDHLVAARLSGLEQFRLQRIIDDIQ